MNVSRDPDRERPPLARCVRPIGVVERCHTRSTVGTDTGTVAGVIGAGSIPAATTSIRCYRRCQP
ncbi:hypothetical protein [Halocatena pleomorpha]|uniref:Uncharacterized protein n=1 Tax=Halocatena pleomorpha TaxID=1785090 RepID=A0A3P3RCD7_9EURY|nr:hypothetical protein [Halocatena pleomorpha]RRJ30984.1 hypothetical protein EIK79_08200 [Halocatena pleomorpha]